MKYMKVYRAKEYTGVRFIDASTERDEQIKLKQSVITLTTPEEPYESRGSRTVLRGAGGEIPLAYSTVRSCYKSHFLYQLSTLVFLEMQLNAL